jgi:hypothetical protein
VGHIILANRQKGSKPAGKLKRAAASAKRDVRRGR